MRLQKRYIYAALLAGIAFMVLYTMMDFKILVSLILAIAIYIAGIFMFKSVDIITYDGRAISRYYFEMSKLNDYKEKIKDKKIYDKLTKIVNVTQKITKYLETKPTNATKIYNFMDYYLTYTTKIVTKYIEVDKKEEKTFVENQLFLKLNVYLKEIETECNRLLSEIAKSKDRELDFEMKVFEKTSDLDVDLNVEEGSDKNA
ncbi:MAG: 5-bromo-4-chloroindolyl phosphate hydrolysis family protein [Bacilli bacterium]|nr:5-bromo-4-chloroindolyl phosphate hydrolysis family protein [Bacilli bacterium]